MNGSGAPILAWVLCILILGGCQTPVPLAPSGRMPQMPTTFLATVSTPVPDHSPDTDDPGNEAWSRFVDDGHGVVYTYPSAWSLIRPTDEDLSVLLATLEEGAEEADVDDLATMVGLFAASPEQLDAFSTLGFLPSEIDSPHPAYVNNFSALVMPVEGLDLTSYANLVGAQLEESGYGYLRMQEVSVVAGFRPQGQEVASLRYSLDGTLHHLSDLPLTGWQVVLLDEAGDRFLVVTFTDAADDFHTLETQLAEFIEGIQFQAR